MQLNISKNKVVFIKILTELNFDAEQNSRWPKCERTKEDYESQQESLTF